METSAERDTDEGEGGVWEEVDNDWSKLKGHSRQPIKLLWEVGWFFLWESTEKSVPASIPGKDRVAAKTKILRPVGAPKNQLPGLFDSPTRVSGAAPQPLRDGIERAIRTFSA